MTSIDLLAHLSAQQTEQVKAYFHTILQEKDEGAHLPFGAAYIEHLLNCITIMLLRGIDRTPCGKSISRASRSV